MKHAWILSLVLTLLWPIGSLGVQRGVVLIEDPGGQSVRLYEDSYALVVGVSRYRNGWPSLPGVPDDVRQVQAALKDQGFKVTLVEDPDHEELQRAFNDFITAHGGAPDRRLLFYFAGHGATLEPAYGGEMGYIVPADAPLPAADPDGFRAKALDMQSFELFARRIQSKHALFLFDSCFSGTIFALSRAVPMNISYKTARPVRQFITSGSKDETVPDKSIFRAQFLEALAGEGDTNGDGYVSGTELGEFLQETVVNYSRDAQHPQYGKIRDRRLDKGDFVFALAKPSKTSTSPSAQQPPPPPPVRWQGNVQVNVNVPAIVYINDMRVGEAKPDSPLNHQGVAIGRTEVRVEAADFKPATQTAQVQRGEWTQLIFELKRLQQKASLTVRSNVYGDRVYIDGQEMGSTRLDVELAPGRHSVRVEKDGYLPYEKTVELEAGRDTLIRASLSREAVAVERTEPVRSDDLLSAGVYDVLRGSGFDELLLGGTVTSDRRPGSKHGTMEIALRMPSGRYVYRVETRVEGNQLQCTIIDTNDSEYLGHSFMATLTRVDNQYSWVDNVGRRMTLEQR